MILQNISRRVVGEVLDNISPADIFLIFAFACKFL